MANDNNKDGKTTESAPAASTPTRVPAPDSRGKFEIRAKAEGYGGMHPLGLRFRDGVAYTDDPIKAHACLEFGCTVVRTATGKPAWPARK